jgi:hypothetical protein
LSLSGHSIFFLVVSTIAAFSGIKAEIMQHRMISPGPVSLVGNHLLIGALVVGGKYIGRLMPRLIQLREDNLDIIDYISLPKIL